MDHDLGMDRSSYRRWVHRRSDGVGPAGVLVVDEEGDGEDGL